MGREETINFTLGSQGQARNCQQGALYGEIAQRPQRAGRGRWEVATRASKQVPWAPSSMLGTKEWHLAGRDSILASLSEQAEEDTRGQKGLAKNAGLEQIRSLTRP